MRFRLPAWPISMPGNHPAATAPERSMNMGNHGVFTAGPRALIEPGEGICHEPKESRSRIACVMWRGHDAGIVARTKLGEAPRRVIHAVGAARLIRGCRSLRVTLLSKGGVVFLGRLVAACSVRREPRCLCSSCRGCPGATTGRPSVAPRPQAPARPLPARPQHWPRTIHP